MWIADQWKDYEVLDTSGGEKLERWGDISPRAAGSPGYLGYAEGPFRAGRKMNGHYHQQQ